MLTKFVLLDANASCRVQLLVFFFPSSRTENSDRYVGELLSLGWIIMEHCVVRDLV